MGVFQSQPSLSKALSQSFRYLATRPRSQSELSQYLLRKHSPEIVDAALRFLENEGLIDDHKFAQSWVQSRLTNNPRSSSVIATELRMKGVIREAIESALHDADDSASAYKAVRKFTRRLSEPNTAEFRRKSWQFLRRRGFSSSVIRQTLATLQDAPSESP
jgi:regulatory protein